MWNYATKRQRKTSLTVYVKWTSKWHVKRRRWKGATMNTLSTNRNGCQILDSTVSLRLPKINNFCPETVVVVNFSSGWMQMSESEGRTLPCDIGNNRRFIALDELNVHKEKTREIRVNETANVTLSSSSSFSLSEKHQVSSKSFLAMQPGQPGIEACTCSCPRIK